MNLSTLMTPEGLPLGDYRKLELALALPPSALSALVSALVRTTTTEDLSYRPLHIPKNAIVYMFHEDLPVSQFAPKFWSEIMPFSVLGYHGFASYTGVAWPWTFGVKACRFERRSGTRPLDTILAYLSAHPNERFGLRTDSGGPYGVVRASLLDMAIGSGRPLVAAKQTASRRMLIRGHSFPLAGARIQTHVSAPVLPETLQGLSRDEGRILLQNTIDTLAP